MGALSQKLTPEFIEDRFGSRRAFLAFWRYQLRYSLGAYRAYGCIDWSRVERLVFICKGNICRSPLGEYAARRAGASACSAGLDCGLPRAADERAIAFASRQGLPLDRHQTTAVQELRIGSGDLLVAMEPQHLASLQALGLDSAQMTLLGLWCSPRRPYIADPFCASASYFHHCETLVMQGAQALAAAMLRGSSLPAEGADCARNGG